MDRSDGAAESLPGMGSQSGLKLLDDMSSPISRDWLTQDYHRSGQGVEVETQHFTTDMMMSRHFAHGYFNAILGMTEEQLHCTVDGEKREKVIVDWRIEMAESTLGAGLPRHSPEQGQIAREAQRSVLALARFHRCQIGPTHSARDEIVRAVLQHVQKPGRCAPSN